ncbi:hypothetical protein IPM65_01385 [Candidatus Roizmanbacteria bacterium]|nr:MAG: hypothetical protein IPM65_01385 [Candidatus Roizmanbacteria bacterium]
MKTTICFSCTARVPDIKGPTHPYILSLSGCWKLYGEILAKDYLAEYFDPLIHRIVVDSYAVTHPGDENNRKAVRSVNIHLISLYYIFEKGFKDKILRDIIKRAAENKEIDKHYHWITPPSFKETLNVTDVLKANNPSEHKKLVQDWGSSVWKKWKTDHIHTIEYVAGLVEEVIK